MSKLENIPCSSFYGQQWDEKLTVKESNKLILPLYHCRKLRKLQGPSIIWKTFKKQDDCLQFVRKKKDLMPFTFETVSNTSGRIFLAANPLVFWYYYNQRFDKDRHCYEIIQEFKPCKLYFDLEYEFTYNENRDGVKMVDCFIDLVCYALKMQYHVRCDRSQVLDLDSSSKLKFSRHLIFQLSAVVFEDNYNAGLFVKRLCYEIQLIIQSSDTNSVDLVLLKGVPISIEEIEQLLVINRKGIKVLFCDEAVYSKNRHFRLYGSSKLSKIVPLVLSKQNQFCPTIDLAENFSEQIFLSSLITFVPNCEGDSCRRLQFQWCQETSKILPLVPRPTCRMLCESSPFPDVDRFIADIIDPGQIWRTAFFPSKGVITYDIVHNRYCGNIGRQHKSNNVKYVVSIVELVYYQKCYDPDCAGYTSEKRKLPFDLTFLLNDKRFSENEWSEISEISDANFKSYNYEEENSFPDFGLPDSELLQL